MKRLTELWAALKRVLGREDGGERRSSWVTRQGLVRVPVRKQPSDRQVPPQRHASSAWLIALLLASLAIGPAAYAEESAAPTTALPAALTKRVPENLDDLRQIEKHVEGLSDKLIGYTVHVSIGSAQGSGVLIGNEGYVLTAGHVSGRPGRNVSITFHDGRRVQGITMGRNQSIDSGLIKITDEVTDGGEWQGAEMGASDTVHRGDWCLCLGHPGGYQKDRPPVLRLGRVLRADETVIRTDCPLVGGDSGGPLFDMNGKVIGIHSRIAAPTTANFHVPIVTYSQTWDRLVANEEWSDTPSGPVIGIRGQDDEKGCLVTEAFPDKPAAAAGLKMGDIITHFDGQEISSLAGLILQMSKHKVGEEIEIEYLRGEETKTVKLVLASR
ncbi:MAG: serine protease [Planctomycetia bacterium]|nr:serine protease [Planctomycetia bacterium]